MRLPLAHKPINLLVSKSDGCIAARPPCSCGCFALLRVLKCTVSE
jgi:hypothetical protein